MKYYPFTDYNPVEDEMESVPMLGIKRSTPSEILKAQKTMLAKKINSVRIMKMVEDMKARMVGVMDKDVELNGLPDVYGSRN